MDGIINVYKEQGFTSFDVVAVLRGIFHQKKIGHTGTLDPMAEGVLPVCLGNATKLCEMLTDHDKEYEAVMVLGETYDTEDTSGTKLTEQSVMSTESEIRDAIISFVGGYNQIPPMFSAKKVDGKKLVDLAREGKIIERRSVPVRIYDIETVSIDIPYVTIRVKCGKGTYIRTLISDIGKKLGCGAAMAKLTRTSVGDFDVSGSLRISEIEQLVNAASDMSEIGKHIVPIDKVFERCKEIAVPPQLCKLIDNGNVFYADSLNQIECGLTEKLTDGEKVRMYNDAGKFSGVYEYSALKRALKPYRMFI